MTDSASILTYVRSLGLELGPDAPPDGRVVRHPDSDDEYDRSPLVVVVDGGECRASVAHFSDNELVPGLSITFDSDGHPVLATDTFGRETATDAATAELARSIRTVYSRSTVVEVL